MEWEQGWLVSPVQQRNGQPPARLVWAHRPAAEQVI
jgi:hypothetical protein